MFDTVHQGNEASHDGGYFEPPSKPWGDANRIINRFSEDTESERESGSIVKQLNRMRRSEKRGLWKWSG